VREVSVKLGTARVRIIGQQDVFLATGQTWKAPVVTAEVQPIHTPAPVVVSSPRAPAPSPRLTSHRASPTPTEPPAAPRVPAMRTMADASPNEAPPAAITELPKTKVSTTPVEQHFSAGWQLLRAGKNAEAARELAAAADAGGDDPLAGDARYFEAVALTKAGRKPEAEHALVAFLDRSPHALRRGRAAVMLARLIAERGDRAAATTWFEAASHDPDPDVAAAAKAGLAAP
jgi:TolA-binding protein